MLVWRRQRNLLAAGNRTPQAARASCAAILRATIFRRQLSCTPPPGDKEIKAKGDQMVDDLAKAQSKLSGGYLSAFPTEWFDRLDARKPVWAPFYTVHKIMAGMLDQYQLTGNKQALEVVQGMAKWADDWTAPKSEEHMQSILETEYGGMNEVLYNLAVVSNDDRWAKAGDRFTKKRVFNPLALGRDELRGLHVNTHIPQVIGAARRYEISGDERFRDVSDFFLYTVRTGRTYVTGGTSNGEGWLTQPHLLAAELKRSVATAECCCAYNMLKLARHAYSWTADPQLLRLLRADPDQSPHRHHSTGKRLHAVLSFADAGRVEDLQYRRSIVLVLHRHGR